MLAVDADTEHKRRGAVQDIPLAAIVHRQPGKVAGEAALVPSVAIAVLLDVLDPGGGVLDHRLADSGEVTRRNAHPACATRRTETVDGYVGAALGADRLPYEFTHQVGI